MQSVVLFVLGLYFKTLARISPKTAGRKAYDLFSTPRTRRSVPPWAEDTMARAERLTLEVEGESAAAYRWRPEGVTDAPVVLLVHGWESRAARLAVWVEPLLQRGFQVAAFDGPAHGDSGGRRSGPLPFARCLDRLVEEVGPVTGLVGHSLGGLTGALALSAGRWSGNQDLTLDRMVVVAGAESGVDAMGYFCRVLGLGEGFLPLILDAASEASGGHRVADFDGHRILADRPVPTLWLHDPEDREVPFSGAEKVAAACPHVTLEVVSDLGHHRIVRDPAVVERGVQFLAGAVQPSV
ncbi:MAG: alpha/beta hydrolase [Acidobacteriota bacterium]